MRVLAQKATDALVLLNIDDGTYYALNEVGARIWELSDGTRSVADIIAIIEQEYDAPRATVEADVAELVEELAREQLLILSD